MTSASLYGLDTQILPLESWSTKATILDSLTYHFESTDALLRESTRVFEDRSDAASKEKYLQETREMLVELGEFIFAGYEERILFLTR